MASIKMDGQTPAGGADPPRFSSVHHPRRASDEPLPGMGSATMCKEDLDGGGTRIQSGGPVTSSTEDLRPVTNSIKEGLLAQVMVRDACSMNTSCYFAATSTPELGSQEEAHQDSHSVWSTERIEWNIWLNQSKVQWFLTVTVWTLMAITLIEEPYDNRINFWDFNLSDVPGWISHTIFFACHGVLLALFVLVLYCMWPTRHLWLAKNLAQDSLAKDIAKENRSTFWSSTSATEQWWTLFFGFAVISSIIIRMAWLLHDDANDNYPWRYSRNTIFGPLNSGLDVWWRSFRCLYLLYLSPKMRYGFVSALYVITKLGSIAGLVIISFLFHYFLIVAFLPLDDEDKEWSLDNLERAQYFSNTNEGIYHMFVSLTTANHPDVLMPSYNRQWYMMVLLFSFMLVTNLFLLNVFLGVVTSAYSEMVKQFYLGKYEVCEALLTSAFKLIATGESDKGITKQDFKKVIVLLSGSRSFKKVTSGGSRRPTSAEIQELWYNVMDVDGDKWINLEEFEKLNHIVSMPFVKVKDNTRRKWRFEGVRALMEHSHYKDFSTYALCIRSLILFSIINALYIHPAPESTQDLAAIKCWDSSNVLSMFFGLVFAVDCAVTFMADSTYTKPFRFFHGQQWFSNWTDLSVVIIIFIDVGTTCSGARSRFVLMIGLLRVFRCVRMIQQVESFRRMYNAATRVIPAVTPQLLLFVTTYYCFAVIGMALFAGCVTEVVEDGGPGDWSTSNTTVGGPQWNTSTFGQEEFYCLLNFDSLYSSCMTLFMLMIQNNWHVTVDGYVQCTGTKYVRVFFVFFNIVTAMILINIFTGVVVDMFDHFWHDEKDKMGQSSDDEDGTSSGETHQTFYHIIGHRLDNKYSKGDKECMARQGCEGCEECGEPLSKTWGVSHEMDSGLLYSGVSPSDSVMLLSENSTNTELRGLNSILNDSPMPIYVRTEGNKIAFANTVFAGLYDTTPESLIGSNRNYHLHCSQCPDQWCEGTDPCWKYHKKMRSNEHNLAAIKGDKPVEYEEYAILKDGTEVNFNCTEKKVEISLFKNTTVVYMFPINKQGRVLLDTDGDGKLSKHDQSPAIKPTLGPTTSNPLLEEVLDHKKESTSPTLNVSIPEI